MFGNAVVPSAVFFLLLWPIPESPRWLVQRGRTEQANEILARIAGKEASEIELQQIQAAIAEKKGSYSELFSARLFKPLCVGIALAILQQVSGINAIMYYGPRIF